MTVETMTAPRCTRGRSIRRWPFVLTGFLSATLAGARDIPPAAFSSRMRKRGRGSKKLWLRQTSEPSLTESTASAESTPSTSSSIPSLSIAAAALTTTNSPSPTTSDATTSSTSTQLSATTSTTSPTRTSTTPTSTSTSTSATTNRPSTSERTLSSSISRSTTSRSTTSSLPSIDVPLIPVTTFVMNGPGLMSTISIPRTPVAAPSFNPGTLGPEPTVNAIGATSDDSFWDNKGAVAGIFTAGGLVVLALMVAVGLYIRRYYAKRKEDEWLNTYQDVGSSTSSRRLGSSPSPSMAEVTSTALPGAYPARPTFPNQNLYTAQDIYSDYPPGTQYTPYVPPEVMYGTAITHDGPYTQNPYAPTQGDDSQRHAGSSFAPTVASDPSTYSSASSPHPYAFPVVTVTPAPDLPPVQDSRQRPLSYDSFYTSQPSPRV